MSCLIGGGDYPALAATEAAVKALAIERRNFDRALSDSALFRQFVFTSFADRLAGVIQRIESVALTPVDQRLAREILRTHQEGGASIHDSLTPYPSSDGRRVRLRCFRRYRVLSALRGGGLAPAKAAKASKVDR